MSTTKISNREAAESFCNTLAWTGCERAVLVIQDHDGSCDVLTNDSDREFLEKACAAILADPLKTQ